jgi:hypothetical protein
VQEYNEPYGRTKILLNMAVVGCYVSNFVAAVQIQEYEGLKVSKRLCLTRGIYHFPKHSSVKKSENTGIRAVLSPDSVTSDRSVSLIKLDTLTQTGPSSSKFPHCSSKKKQSGWTKAPARLDTS